MERFTELINQLAETLSADLYPDRNGVCLISFDDVIRVQLEPDSRGQNMIISTFICEVPPGKLRENILKDALKANGPFPVNGTIAYSERNNHLVLFAILPFENLNGKKCADFLNTFIEKASQWHKAIETGNTAQLAPTSQKTTTNVFGLKP